MKHLTETPETDRSIRQLASKIINQIITNPPELITGTVDMRVSNNKIYRIPVGYIKTSLPDLVIGYIVVPRGDTSAAFIYKLKGKTTTIPSNIKFIIAYPLYGYWNNFEKVNFNINNLIYDIKSEKDIFVHEFVHYWDFSHMIGKDPNHTSGFGSDYFNSVLERNAYYHEGINSLENSNIDLSLPFKKFMEKAMKFFNWDFLSHLSEQNKKRLITRLYALWSEKQR